MELFKAIKERRSIRKYTDKAIDKATMEKLLDAAKWAPNAGNYNAWKFIVINEPAQTKQLLNFCPGLNDVPAAIVLICSKPKQKKLADKVRLMYMADCAIASQNLVLAAYAEGIGSCVVVSFADVALREILEIPDNVYPFMMVTLGYPSETPEPPPRLPLSEIVYKNEYGKEWK